MQFSIVMQKSNFFLIVFCFFCSSDHFFAHNLNHNSSEKVLAKSPRIHESRLTAVKAEENGFLRRRTTKDFGKSSIEAKYENSVRMEFSKTLPNSRKNLFSSANVFPQTKQHICKKYPTHSNKKDKKSFNAETYFDSYEVEIHPDLYPVAKRNESIVERRCLHEMKDPYRWLEDPESVETKAYISNLNNFSRPFFELANARQVFRENQNLTIENGLVRLNFYDRLGEFYEQRFYGCIAKHGHYYYYYYNSGHQNQSSIYRQRVLHGPRDLFLDPNEFSSDGSVAIGETKFTRDGSIMAYTLNEKGSDVATIHFRHTSGHDLHDRITGVKLPLLAWMPNNRGIFYSKYSVQKRMSENSKVTRDEYKALYYHRIGTDASKDILVADFREMENPNLMISAEVSSCGRFLFVYVHDRTQNAVHYLDLRAIDYHIKPLPALTLIFHDPRSYITILDYDHESETLLALTDYSAQNLKLIRVRLSEAMLGAAHWETVIPEDSKRTLSGVTPVAQDFLMVEYLEDVKTTLYVHGYKSGKLLYKIPLGIGTVTMCYGDRNDTEVFFAFNSFLEPMAFYRADFSKVHETELINLEEIRHTDGYRGIDLPDVEVHQEFYTSKDGTQIPIFIIARKNLTLDGKNPTLLYGYGGFSIPLLPSYSANRNIFIKHFHGVAAIANIRGGGEYGEYWHECGVRDKKQNVFDDFVAAAEFLIEKKYTSPSKLAIQGASNGGLLVAVCSQQRPELFGAVINQVGVLDMVRFHQFTVGSSWISEYGNPERPHDFDNILRYSPLHNIHLPARGVQWPATLLMTADHDDRVVPSHTLKYVASLYHYLKRSDVRYYQRKPVIARIATNTGHGQGKPIYKAIDDAVDIMSFLQRVLRLKWYN